MDLPRNIGRYEVLRPLGSGGMAQVYLARSTGEGGFEKQVAIKRILPELGLVDDRVVEFTDEARLVAQLTHPGIVQVFSFERDDDTHFLVMEYVDGMTLTKVLELGRMRGMEFPLGAAASVAVQVCEALAYAHEATAYDGQPMRIVHRDIKPSNVMITTDGQVKLADFGIARATTHIHRTRTGKGKGTMSYMAPEQFDGREVTTASDLYALGAVVHEMVAGRMLYDATGLSPLLERRREGFRAEDEQRIARRAPELVPLLRSCLADRAEDRPGDARWVASRLRELPFFGGREELRAWIRALTVQTETVAEFDQGVLHGGIEPPDTAPLLSGKSPIATIPGTPAPPLAEVIPARSLLDWVPWIIAGLAALAVVALLLLWHPWSTTA